MNEFAAVGLVIVVAAVGREALRDPFWLGVFVAGALVLVLNYYLSNWYTDWLWRRRGWLEIERAAQKKAEAEEGEIFGGQWDD